MDRFLAGVERRALRIAEIALRDRDEAMDVVQEAMLQLARRYGQLPPEQWPPLFYRILQNKIRDWQRRLAVTKRIFFWHARSEENEDSEWLDDVADPAQPQAQDLLQREQAMQRLERALAELPRRQREVFELRIWQGLNVEETAQAMSCSTGSVKTHLFRALAALRDDLKGVWP